ncbi:MAG TPA: hypothetical protein VLM40_04620 [Gemmata sp.]|nr:hypothetical protein [Gemmata sp.]
MADMRDRAKNAADIAADKATEAAHAGKQEVQSMADRAKEGAQHLADKAGEYAGQARDKVSEWARDAKQGARDAGNRVADWAGDAYEYTSDQVSTFGKEVTSLIRNHPLPAVLIGFGIGVLMGRTARIL